MPQSQKEYSIVVGFRQRLVTMLAIDPSQERPAHCKRNKLRF